MQLDDLDFAFDLALLSQTQQEMQEKTTSSAAVSVAIGLNINKGKSKVLRYNTACTNQITLHGEGLEDVKTFTYLGGFINEHGGSDADVKALIGKATATCLQLWYIWNSKQPSVNQHQARCIYNLDGLFNLVSRSFTVRDVISGFPADYLLPPAYSMDINSGMDFL
ncbi:unnamed protein product [Schistosoma curassoni]|uniref:Reverse transcriptase domain-containing protein n=1 Tax=Schistosoma curassoni TaxID=6186 RepID=A0A183KVK0_9TREM|nr:unnamed protein product [Schistosoma curassoni]